MWRIFTETPSGRNTVMMGRFEGVDKNANVRARRIENLMADHPIGPMLSSWVGIAA